MKHPPFRSAFYRSRTGLYGAIIAVCLSTALTPCFAQPITVSKVDPPNWWTGMQHDTVQLMVYGTNLGNVSAHGTQRGLRVVGTVPVANASYAFVNVEIPPGTSPGTYPLTVANSSDSIVINYRVGTRREPAGRFGGFSSGDAIYLIMPDRFANGDTTNDAVPAMREGTHRSDPNGRHGGDIRGIIQHLPYLADLGATCIWITPLIENNSPAFSYHGYAATDHYTIDPRYGDNNLYQVFVEQAHRTGLKVIMDHVNNHISINHPWIKNLPTPDWINGSVARHLITHHENMQVTDIHADSATRSDAAAAWFTDEMPDLNQNNQLVARYLTENTLWWVESTGIDGIREDTCPYTDPVFLSRWAADLLREYPSLGLVGEVWISNPAFLSAYQRGGNNHQPWQSNLPSITDFALTDAFLRVFRDSMSIREVYTCLAQDFLYSKPDNLVTFLGNHDTQRIMAVTGGDARRTKLALGLLLTTRGIPQLLYGTEIGMAGGTEHGSIRSDFPGGFPGDARNAFLEKGRKPAEQDMFLFVQHLLRLRRDHPELSQGNLIQFPPSKEAYLYFRELGSKRVLVVANNSRDARHVSLTPCRQRLAPGTVLHNLLTGESFALPATFEVTVPGSSISLFAVLLSP